MKFFGYCLAAAALLTALFASGCTSTPEPPPPTLAPISSNMRQRAAEWNAVWQDFSIRGVVITPVTRNFYRNRDDRLIERIAMLGVNQLYLPVQNRGDLDDLIESGRLGALVRQAAAAGIGTELVLIQQDFMPQRYGSVIRRRRSGNSEPLPEAIDRILQYNANAAPEEQLVGVTVAASIHTFTPGAENLPANLLYLWHPGRYGIGSDNDLLMAEWFQLLTRISRQTARKLPLTAAFPVFYQTRAAAGELSAGSVADFLELCDRAWVIGTGTRPSAMLSSLRQAADSVREDRRVICGTRLASHLSEDSGALRRRDWQDLVRSMTSQANALKDCGSAAGMVVDSWDELEWLWEQE